MAYTFTNTPFQWTKTGTTPTAAELELGLQGGMALPAGFVNQQWTATYLSVQEIQSIIEDGSVFRGIKGISVGSGNSLTTGDTYTGVAIGSGNSALVGDESKGGAVAIGTGCEANGDNSIATGAATTALAGNTVVGIYNKTPTAVSGTTGDLFTVGNGIQGGAKSNAFRVTYAGEVMGTQAYSASGADYAEAFEWIDGNPENEDRRGLFVTLDGEKIRPATDEDDYILGVISATPSVIGDARTDDWHGKYATDVFGAKVLENGSYKLADGFEADRDDNYTSRLERPEWGIVGLVGKLVVVDDGTCEVNGYCSPAAGGVATASETGYRVMARLDETHIKVLVK